MRMIVVSGLPCSGKSKFAEQLAMELHWPLLCKDTYKELLFDTLGYSDRAWSKRVSSAAYALQFAQAEQFMTGGIDCLLEGNFRWEEHRERFANLLKRPVALVQVYCRADVEVLLERFRLRARSGSRHPGHVDAESLQEIETELRSAPQNPLPLQGETIECDTSVDWQAAIAAALQQVRASLLKRPQYSTRSI